MNKTLYAIIIFVFFTLVTYFGGLSLGITIGHNDSIHKVTAEEVSKIPAEWYSFKEER